MRVLDKYIFREFLIPLAFCLVGFSMLNVVYDLFGSFAKILDAKVSIVLVINYYFCIMLQTLEYILPDSLLLATLYTQWRLARNNELTAMRACGVSFYRIMVPYLVVATMFSIVSMVIKETVTPKTNAWVEELSENKFKESKHHYFSNLAYYNSIHSREWLVDMIDLRRPNTLGVVRVRLERKDKTCYEEIFAQKAKWLDGQWWFFNGYRQIHNTDGVPDRSIPPVMLADAGELIPELTETPTDLISEVRVWQHMSSSEMLDYLRKHPNISREAVADRKTDLHVRLAIPWACLLVTVFGIPVGAISSKQNVMAGIFIAVAFFLGFYLLLQMGIFWGKKQILFPWLGAWFSNIVSLAAGVVMIRRMR